MKFSQGVQNFWVQVGLSFLCAGLIPCVLLIGVRVHWLLALGFSGVLFSFFLVSFLRDTKNKIIHSLPNDWQYAPAQPQDFPGLNTDLLQRQTQALESIGFVIFRDYSVEPGSGFSRCFIHPQHYCFAEIGQLFHPTTRQLSQTHSVIFSVLTEDWLLASIGRAAGLLDSLSYAFWRKPKWLRLYYADLALDELVQAHLKFRQQMLNDLAIQVSSDLSWDAYSQGQRQAAQYRKQAVQQKSLLFAMIKAIWFELNPKSEWLEDYPRAAAKRRKRP
jgi:hypothetical protein